jgi:hypothetical protein
MNTHSMGISPIIFSGLSFPFFIHPMGKEKTWKQSKTNREQESQRAFNSTTEERTLANQLGSSLVDHGKP